MPRKPSKLWKELFSPPCPKCNGMRTKEEIRKVPLVFSGKEFVDFISAKTKGQVPKPIRTWRCLDCETLFDEKGRYIAVG